MVTQFHKPVVCPVLIDRVNDLATLHALIDQAKSGRGQVALLCGEAGVGKSRLVAETKAYAAAQDFLLLQGNCFQADISSPYAPLLDLVRSSAAGQFVAAASSDLAPFARELHQFVPDIVPLPPNLVSLSSLDPEQEKRRLFTALAQFFINQATRRPVLFIIEDIHWSDDSSLEFLHYLARRCAVLGQPQTLPLLFLLTYRSDEVHPSLRHFLAQSDRDHLAQEIPLTPLTRRGIDAMLRAIFAFPHSAQLELPDPIYTLTEGNPFFVEEILKSLIMTGDIFYVDGRWNRKSLSELHIPRSVQDAVHQRTDHLSERARRVLILAAVAGRRFDFALLQQLTQYDESQLLSLMKELIAAQLVVEESEERFAFRHALTRQAVYTDLLVRERKALHRTIAETMEGLYAPVLDAHIADLAYHFHEAGAWEQALQYGKRAGEEAQAMYASRAAIEQFTRALDAAQHASIPPPATLYHLRGRAYETLGNFERARSDYEQALHIAHDAGESKTQWQSLMDLGFLWLGRDYERAGVFFRQALALTQHEREGHPYDPIMHAHSLNRLGNWLVNIGQAAEGLQVHQQALTLLQIQQETHGIAETLDLLGMAYGIYGDGINAVKHFGQAVELFRALGDYRGLINSLVSRAVFASPAQDEVVFTASGNPAECERDAAEARSLAHQMDWPADEAYSALGSGIVTAYFGNFGLGLALAKQALRVATEIEHQQWMAAAHCSLGAIYVLMLEPALALQHLEAGLPLAQQLGSAWWIGNIVSYRALAYLLKGELTRAEEALRALMPPEQSPRNSPERRIVWAWGKLALAQGQPDIALQVAEHLLQSAPGAASAMGTQLIPHLLKLKGEALIMLKRLDEAARVLEEAKKGALERQETPIVWQIYCALGRVYRLLRREEEARSVFAAARRAIASLAETIDDAHLREHFSLAALKSFPKEKSVSPNHAAKQAFGGLTTREREVAALIAQGKFNREIAEALVVNERTIETHVSNIMFKLGFTSRTQIAAWTVEKGLTANR
jgi:DNA-binding CsgD family transcriptional regulator/tetratricopeptide (TPR) repeat protein